MKIAILSRDRNTHPGGDIVQIDATIAALKTLGVEAKYLDDNESLAGYDLAHVFHVNFGWSKVNFKKVRAAGLPVVVTPIFYPTQELGMNYREIATELSRAKYVLPFSDREALEMKFALLSTKVLVTPNATDSKFESFLESSSRDGVLCVAAREGDKNSSLVRQACEQLNVPFRLAIGLSREETIAAYQKSRVFVNASESERMSLTIGEGLVAGCRVLATTENWGNEWYGRYLKLISPWNYPHLVQSIKEAYEAPEWDFDPNKRARIWTWTMVAGMIKDVYKEVLCST